MITFNNLEKYGRFGNQLFHIASTIGIAIRNGYDYGFLVWEEHKYFKNVLPRLLYDINKEYKLISPEGGLLTEYEDFTPPDNVSLLGHFFSEKYFLHCEKTIRHYFEMKPIEGIPKIEKNSIAIHVRAGDFGIKQFPMLTEEYYERALNHFYGRDINQVYIFSDDIKKAKELLSPIFTYIETDNYIHDFYLMRQCKHFIIANSTFSWWAAWLGLDQEKTVIAPKNMHGATYTDEMYPKNWIVL